MRAASTNIQLHQVAVQLGGTLALTVVSIFATALAVGGALRCVAGVYLGEEVGWRESLRFALRRLGSIVLVSLLVLLCELVGLLFCIIGYAVPWTFLFASIPALLVEGLKGRARSDGAATWSGRGWHVFATLGVGYLIDAAITGALAGLLVAVLFASHGNVVVFDLVTGVVTLITTVLVTPFTAALTMAVYFDLRRAQGGLRPVAPGAEGGRRGPRGRLPGPARRPAVAAGARLGRAPPATWDAPPPGWGPPVAGGPPPTTWGPPGAPPWGAVPPPPPPPPAPPGWAPAPATPAATTAPKLPSDGGWPRSSAQAAPRASHQPARWLTTPAPWARPRMLPIADVPRRLALATLAVALVVALPAGAAAARPAAAPPGPDVSRQALAQLAARAEHDPAALLRLRQVRQVDGRPVDLRSSLATTSPDELRIRLRELAGQSPGPAEAGGTPSPPPVTTPGTAGGTDPAAARRDAGQVLAQHRFRAAHEPQPLRGVLRWIGDRARPVLEPIGRAARSVGRSLFGNDSSRIVTLVVLAGLVIWGAVVLSRRRGRGRGAVGAGPTAGWTGVARSRRAQRQAVDAEAAGDLEQALRLRFQAGLIRLHLLGVLDAPVDGPNGQLAGTLGSEEFDDLAHTFDEVVYGRREPVEGDVAAARREWPKVLEEQRR